MNKSDYPKSGLVELQTTQDLKFYHVSGGNFIIESDYLDQFHYGLYTFPKGTKTSNLLSMVLDNSGDYNFATEFPFDRKHFAYHDAMHRGVNIPLKYLEHVV